MWVSLFPWSWKDLMSCGEAEESEVLSNLTAVAERRWCVTAARILRVYRHRITGDHIVIFWL